MIRVVQLLISTVLLFHLVAFAHVCDENEDEDTCFAAHLARHSIGDEPASARALRRYKFHRNFVAAKSHCKAYAAGLSSFTVSMEHAFADQDPEDINKLQVPPTELHWQRKREAQTSNDSPLLRRARQALPAAVDWRNVSGVVSPVQNQGSCAGCYAFATAESLEGQLALEKNTPNQTLSAQNIIDCSGSYGDAGCNGGWLGYAYTYVQQKGLTNITYYPYTGLSKACAYSNSIVPSAQVEASYRNTTVGSCLYVVPRGNETAIMEMLATFGPLSFAMYANIAGFQLYSGGIYDDPSCPQLNSPTHAMLLVGYNTRNGQNYWIVKNSWGTSWGEQGYIRMAMGINQCGFAYWVVYPQGF